MASDPVPTLKVILDHADGCPSCRAMLRQVKAHAIPKEVTVPA